ncbi:MAG: hypothetical protein JXQ73_12010 [Phycisphaerae bacterium]|nr:hypothetical protein [Phycisphaerae bacterium]
MKPRTHAHLGRALPLTPLCLIVGCQSAPAQSSSPAAPTDLGAAIRLLDRATPTAGPDHPGNVFLSGQDVSLSVPAGLAKATQWRILDDRGNVTAKGRLAAAQQNTPRQLAAGKLGIGWYRVEFLDPAGNRLDSTTTAILARPVVPVSQDSPICIDTATAWFARNNPRKQADFCLLASLAGANWIRDRLTWSALEPKPAEFTTSTTNYDTSADAAVRFGLKSLQVFHGIPNWATAPDLDGDLAPKRYPRDLRALHRFCKEMAKRYKGRLLAWEPWNEANIDPFGGHTIDEMCTLQKAAYLGFKAGDPNVLVCWNVFAGAGGPRHTGGILANETWPYFETFNIHSYQRPDGYDSQFKYARQAAAGRPLWLTECGVRLPAKTKPPWGDMTPEDEIRQAEFIAHSYAASLFAGVNRHFFFILGNYIERGVQFGLLRHDLTPRPGYVAFAALGRFLAGARCLGRVPTPDVPDARVYAFSARPDGKPNDVLIAWSNKPVHWPLQSELGIQAAYDYLGRAIDRGAPKQLTPASVFLLLPSGQAAAKLPLKPPSRVDPPRDGKPCPVVLQLSLPQATTRLGVQAHEVDAGTDQPLPLFAYNFSDRPLQGTVTLASAPKAWQLTPQRQSIEIPPSDRRPIEMALHIPPNHRSALLGDEIKLRGDFGQAGHTMLAFRLIAAPSKLQPATTKPLKAANDPGRWKDNIVGGATMQHGPAPDGGVRFEMHFGQSDPWGYPRLDLRPDEHPDPSIDGLALTVQLLEGHGDVRVQFIEEGGSAYVAKVQFDPSKREPQRALALFQEAEYGSYSKPDANNRLDPDQIRTVLVGINAKRDSTVKMTVRDLAWVGFR